MTEAGRSGTGVRVATAAVLLPAVVGTVWWGPSGLVALLVGAVASVCLWEFFALGERQGLKGYKLWTIGCGLLLVGSQWSAAGIQEIALGRRAVLFAEGRELPLQWALLVFVLGLAALTVLGRRALSEALPSLGMSAAGLLLVAWPLSYIVRMHGLERGPVWLLFTLSLVWAGDTLAYFVGRSVGRLPMAPQISPKKTWEGAGGNVIGSLMVGVIFSRWLNASITDLMLVALLANVAGQLGDLVESAYKRGAGVKDSGSLLPGHGGMLDRVDALIFAAPVVWAYLHWSR